MEIDCRLAACLMRIFFNANITTSIKDSIVTHLIRCNSCRQKYEEYAKAIGTKFEIDEEIKKIYDEYDNIAKEESATMESKEKNSKVTKVRTYYDMAKEKDISSLMNVQSVRERFKEQYNANDIEYMKKLQEFGWYLAEEMCKRIDTLENLYKLSGETEG